MNEFIAFWFETRTDGAVCYETFIDVVRHEWYTCRVGEGGPVLLRGIFEMSLLEDAIIKQVKSLVEAAVTSGRI